MKHGETVSTFERELAAYCGAKYAIAASNGTVTLQAALVALGVKPGDRVATSPLTMSATSIAILNVGAVPVYRDVDPRTWIMRPEPEDMNVLPVDLYGLYGPIGTLDYRDLAKRRFVYDSAQTLRRATPYGGKLSRSFVSLSFQASKILSCGEGGALLTDDEALAERARSYLSLGYKMSATQARIDSASLKSPTFDRHHAYPAINGRMNDLTAAEGLRQLQWAEALGGERLLAAQCYEQAIEGCAFLTAQHVPSGWEHDYWAFAVACDTPERARWLQQRMGELGAEIPYGAWKLTFNEPAFRHLVPHWKERDDDNNIVGICDVAESLQPRILAFQCNNLQSAETNARALRRAIEEAGDV